MESEQLAIADYGLIANGRTAALVGCDGGVGWLCVPRFDAPSICAPLLDPRRGGFCRVWAPALGRGRQRYLPDTNILVTEFGPAARPQLRLTDWMTASGGDGALCRRIEVLHAATEVQLACAPRFDYGLRAAHWTHAAPLWRAEGDPPLWLAASAPLEARPEGLGAALHLKPGDEAWMILAWGAARPEFSPASNAWLRESLRASTANWQQWAAQAQYDGPYRGAVVRSALALKALIYEPTGAIVAAPTASLPEAIGGPRNWDYRYCWPRDATFALYGLSLLGYHDEAGHFLEFVARLCQDHPPPLQVCYRVDGARDVPERELAHLAGYRGSRPVRVGNAAAAQRQLDSYGEVLDAAYTYAKWRQGLDPALWTALRSLVAYAAAHWTRPDESIWEVRGGRQQFLYSKVMCWVALDRGIKLAARYKLPAPIAAWTAVRAQIKSAVFARGYNRSLHSFTQTFDNTELDSSALLLPLLRFTSPREPRMRATIERVRRALSHNSLVARYQNTEADGVGGPEGAFSICTFWMIDCLTLLGRAPEARQIFERMLGHASPLGLFSEEIDPASGALLGNFPQAFTHMALLNSAHNLELYPAGVP